MCMMNTGGRRNGSVTSLLSHAAGGLPIPSSSLLFLRWLSSRWDFGTGLPGPLSMWSYFFLAAASHGLLDAMTDGGLGVAFFAPFNNHRYFLPWRPIRVSPIGAKRFFTVRGFAVLQTEFACIWFPAMLLAVLVRLLRQRVAVRQG